MKIYIAGPISGLPGNNTAVFDAAEADLQQLGHEPVNPHKVSGEPGLHESEWYYRKDMAALVTCDAVVVLDGWDESRGALMEVFTAMNLGMPVYRYPLKLSRPLRPEELPPALAAQLLVHGDRMRDYSHPRINVERIVQGWSAIFGAPVTNRQVALALVWLKIARDIGTPKHDNLVDGAGYFEVAYMATKEKKRGTDD